MVPANDNHDSPTRDLLEFALVLMPMWGPSLVVSLASCIGLAWVLG
jgi:hypothetical protein